MHNCTFILSVVCLIFSITASTAAQKKCEECGRRSVKLYDFDVRVPKPDPTVNAFEQWSKCFFICKIIKSTMFNNDPESNCITYLDGHIKDGNLKVGSAVWMYPALPPAGPIDHGDYLITGIVTPFVGDTVKVTVELQAGQSREVVKSVSALFCMVDDGYNDAGAALASQLVPLYSTINEFEQKKRVENNNVAVSFNCGQIIKISPEKTMLNIGEEITVEVALTDCDGKPLSNREVFFMGGMFLEEQMPKSYGGEVKPASCKTDGSGRAKVKFKAGNIKGYGAIEAFLPYKHPAGYHYAALKTTPLFIDQKATLWEAFVIMGMTSQEEYETSNTVIADPTSDEPITVTMQGKKTEVSIYKVVFQAIIKDTQYSLPGFPIDTSRINLNSSEDSILSFKASGSWQGNKLNISEIYQNPPPQLNEFKRTMTTYSGKPRQYLDTNFLSPGFSFSYYKKSGTWSVSCSPEFTGKLNSVYTWHDKSGSGEDISSEPDTFGIQIATNSSKGGRMTAMENDYFIVFDTTVAVDGGYQFPSTVDKRHIAVSVRKIDSEDNSSVKFYKKTVSAAMRIIRCGENVHISLPATPTNMKLELYDVAGRRIPVSHNSGDFWSFRITASGMYILSVKVMNAPEIISHYYQRIMLP